MQRLFIATLIGTVAIIVGGCQKPVAEVEPYEPFKAKDYSRPLPPGALALRKIEPADYPDFGQAYANTEGLRQAIRHSLDYLSHQSSQRYFPYGEISHARAVASLQAFLDLLDAADSPEALNELIRARFDVFESVGCDNEGTVYFTGYYTPIFEGRRQPDSEFRYPLYGLPPQLVKDEEGRTLGWQTADGQLEPCPTRREIEEGRLLDGLEVAWLRSPFEAYVVSVQGSAKLRLDDGSMLELGYAGNNGHDYTPISAAMIADGVIGRDELSLQTLLRYFASHPDQVYHYAWKNDRYVFFSETSTGPTGCLNVPVTRFRSIATDKDVFPRACLAFLVADLPVPEQRATGRMRYATFALDQDRGAAIRAAGRCDLYMGVGPEAESLAGRTGSEGALYYLFVRPEGG